MPKDEKIMKQETKNEQTFSKDVKEEIASNFFELTKEEATIFLAGFIRQTGSLVFNNGKMGMDLQTANAIVARRVYQLLRFHFKEIRIEIVVRKMVKLKKQSLYVLKISDDSKQFFEDVYYFDKDGFDFSIPNICIDNKHLMVGFMQGLFLGSGSVNNLNLQSYHLEISLANEDFGLAIIEEMKKYQLMFKIVKRRKQHILYLKDSTMIGDFLAFMQATNALFAFEDIRITRDMMNSMNRLINCELANEQKSQAATTRQIENTQYVLRKLGRNYFNEKEQSVIDVRFLYQDASLTELSELILEEKKIQISKSGLNHIFRKINKLADQVRANELREADDTDATK